MSENLYHLRRRFEREAPYDINSDAFVTRDGRKFAGFDDWLKNV